MSPKNMEMRPLDLDDSLYTMLRHPSLAAFAKHMLPRPEDADRDIPLKNISRLMPWHSHIRPEAVLAGINRIIDDRARGQTVFYSFYSISPQAQQTGLFFFRGRPDAPFALICPGGGFRYVASMHEGFPLALVLNKRGFNAFVLQYRAGGEDVACGDMAKALSWIFRNAKELKVETRGYSVWGGSAGARMAADLGSYGPRALGGDDLPQPACVVMAYTGHDHANLDVPLMARGSEVEQSRISHFSHCFTRHCQNALLAPLSIIEKDLYKNGGLAAPCGNWSLKWAPFLPWALGACSREFFLTMVWNRKIRGIYELYAMWWMQK